MTNNPGTFTKTSTKLYGLDHLRAFAITFVFIFHYGHLFPSPQWITAIGKFGWTGVDLFFVLSGYLISSQLFANIFEGKKISLRAFFLKRFFRIVPDYLLIVAIYFFIGSARERGSPAPLWKFLTFTQNLGLNLPTQGAFSHAWSLCIEEQFYLLLPLILVVLVYYKKIKKGFLLLIALFIVGFAARWYTYTNIVRPLLDQGAGWIYWYKWIYYPTWCRLDGLLTGVGIAALFRFRALLGERISRHGNFILLAGIVVLSGAYYVCLEEQSFTASVFGFPLVSIGYGLLVMGAISPTSVLYKFKSGITATIATFSYAIYLSHKIIIHFIQALSSKLTMSIDSNFMFLICLVACLAGALLMNRIIEKPVLKLRNKILVK